MDFEFGGDNERDDGCNAIAPFVDPERAYPRPETCHAPASVLLCQARLGRLSSVLIVDPGFCGSAEGCDGRWYCLTGKRPDQAACRTPKTPIRL